MARKSRVSLGTIALGGIVLGALFLLLRGGEELANFIGGGFSAGTVSGQPSGTTFPEAPIPKFGEQVKGALFNIGEGVAVAGAGFGLGVLGAKLIPQIPKAAPFIESLTGRTFTLGRSIRPVGGGAAPVRPLTTGLFVVPIFALTSAFAAPSQFAFSGKQFPRGTFGSGGQL